MLKVKTNRKAFERIRQASELLVITPGDMRSVVLDRMAAVHREQETRIFSTEGKAGGAGPWPRLSPLYEARKRAAASAGRRAVKGKKGKARTVALRALGRPIANKILVWSGEMRDRFTREGNPYNVARVIVQGTRPVTRYLFQFGARSEVASYHVAGGARLPRRDMKTKTPAQTRALLQVLVDWYRKERLPQVFKYLHRSGWRP